VYFHLFIYLSTLSTQYAEQGLRNGLASVPLSVCPLDRQRQQRAAGLLLSALRGGDIDRRQVPALLLDGAAGSAAAVERRRSAANAGSVTSTVDV